MEQSTVEVITNVIGSLGFPIFVSVWMLVKNSRDNENITIALRELRETIALLSAQISGKVKE